MSNNQRKFMHYPFRKNCSVYIGEEEDKMLRELAEELDSFQTVPVSKIFCLALREYYKKMITEKGK